MKLRFSGTNPLNIVSLRFAIGFPVLAVIFSKRLIAHTTRRAPLGAALAGYVALVASVLVIFGTRITSASTPAFLTSTQTVFVLLISSIWLKRLPGRSIAIGLAFIITGIVLM